jgi:hypothetical protein
MYLMSPGPTILATLVATSPVAKAAVSAAVLALVVGFAVAVVVGHPARLASWVKGGLRASHPTMALGVVFLAIGSLLVGLWGLKAAYHDAWYTHRCINHASDIAECFAGEAGPAPRWCEAHADARRTADCVEDYLANGRPASGTYMCESADPNRFTGECTPEERAMHENWRASLPGGTVPEIPPPPQQTPPRSRG